MITLLLSFAIILAGVGWRTARPYVKKLKEHNEASEKAEAAGDGALPDFKFKKRFLASAGCSFGSCVIIALIIMGQGSPLLANPLQNSFALFAWGAGQTEIINREFL